MCEAYRQFDEMHCARCGLQWSTDDPDPPTCRPARVVQVERAEVRSLRVESARSRALREIARTLDGGCATLAKHTQNKNNERV